MSDNKRNEDTFDPEDWNKLRALGHKMLDDMIDYHQTIRERPVFMTFEKALPPLKTKAPKKPQGIEKAYQDFKEIIIENFPGLPLHPRFWGWVTGTGSPTGILSEMLTGALNMSTNAGTDLTYHVEKQVLSWIKEMLGYPMEASGLLLSGASMANLIGISVARNHKSLFEIRKKGLVGAPRRLTLYCSSETHMAIQKSVELIGLGSENLRYIPTDERYRINLKALKESIQIDRENGLQPFCVIGNAGTVNTGAFDDLGKLAYICRENNLWFHVDGAFGAWTTLAPKLRHLVKGMERADSVAVDLHKWMNITFGLGCVLIRDENAHLKTFSMTPDYLKIVEGQPPAFSDYGVELSRRFRALKVWMAIKEHGTEKFGRMIQQNVDQAEYLAKRIEEAPELELITPVSLNIVCFRYKIDGVADEELNGLNNLLLMVIQSEGIAMPSSTTLNGRFTIRFCNVNHRTRYEDLDFLVSEVLRIGKILQDPSIREKYQKQLTEKLSAIIQP